VAEEIGDDATTERHFQRAVEAVTPWHSGRISLDHWPQVGAVDLMLPNEVGVELKWAKGGDTLVNCSWDVAKLATAIGEGRLVHGFIVAGAPVSHWRSGAVGVTLFDDATYVDDEIVRRYERAWRFW
jgi:hypothetical protein